MGDGRAQLRGIFDSAADRYHRARPRYPAEVYDQLLAATGLRPGARVLEVGCATGVATEALVDRGLRVTAVELGPRLAAAARRNLASRGGSGRGAGAADLVVADFEAWPPPARAQFDAVVAATSWHWIDPAVRYRRAWEVLRPGGHLAFWSAAHVFPDGGDPFFGQLQAVYDEIGEGLPPDAGRPRPGELPDLRPEIERSGRFDVVLVSHVDWSVTYDADGYLDLLDTFSGHLAMAPWQRQRLHGEVRRRLAARTDGLVRRHWGVVLHVARRRS